MDLCRPDTLLVLPDEKAGVGWDGAGPVTYARIDVPAADAGYRYRLGASIALAEVARQLGLRPGRGGLPPRPAYRSWLSLTEPSDVDIVPAAELYDY